MTSEQAFRLKTEYLESNYESWKAVLDKFDSLLKSIRSLSPNPGDALQRLIDDAKLKMASKRDELERIYDGNVELLRKGAELHETTPIVIKLEVNWSQIVRTAVSDAAAATVATSTNLCFHTPDGGGGLLASLGVATPCSEPPTSDTPAAGRSSTNSPCLFGSIGSGLTLSTSAAAANINNAPSSTTSGFSSSVLSSSSRGLGLSNGAASAEPFLNCFEPTAAANNHSNHNILGGSLPDSRIFDSSWLPGWPGVDLAATLTASTANNKGVSDSKSSSISTTAAATATTAAGTSSLFSDILNGHKLFGADSIIQPAASSALSMASPTSISQQPSFSSIVSSDLDKTACFDWIFSCLKEWRAKGLHSVPFKLLLDAQVQNFGETRTWRVLGGDTTEQLAAFMRQYPGVFAISSDGTKVALIVSAPSAEAATTANKLPINTVDNVDDDVDGDIEQMTDDEDVGDDDEDYNDHKYEKLDGSNKRQPIKKMAAPATASTPSHAKHQQQPTASATSSNSNSKSNKDNKSPSNNNNNNEKRSTSLLEMDDFGNTSSASSSSSASSHHSMASDDGSWQEVVKKVAKSNGGKPNQPCATDIRERIIDVLDLAAHGANLARLIAVEILRRAVKENAVPRDLTNESMDRLRAYLPNALSSARGKLARPKPNLPPEHADWTYKTKLCVQFATTRTCTMAAQCRFAHGLAELRPKRRAEFCSYWKKSGSCPRRDSCQYAHSQDELGQYVSDASPGRSASLDLGGGGNGCSTRPALSIQPATMSISLTPGSPSMMANNHIDGDNEDGCWLCKGARRGVASKQLKCGHKYHSQCLNKFSKKQQSSAGVADEAADGCPKCRTAAIASMAVNV